MTKQELTDLIKEVVKDTVAEETFDKNSQPDQNFADQAAKIIKAVQGSNGNAAATEKGRKAGKFIRAIANSKNDPEKAAKWLHKNYPEEEELVKALTPGGEDGTDFVMPTEISTELIELLRNATSVRRLNPVQIAMQAATFQIPKLVAGSNASYVGSDDNIGTTKPGFGMLRLTFKKLAAIVPVSNDLIRHSSPGVDDVVRDDLVNAISEREDQAFLLDDGTENTPKGLLHWCPDSNKFNSNGDTLENITADLATAILNLMESNARMLRPGWLMAPRSAMALMTIRDGNGNYAFRDEMMNGTLWGYPFAVTNNIPVNLGGGSDSKVFMVDFADVVIGQSLGMIIDSSADAAYSDGGNTVAAFSKDQTVIRAIVEHDMGMRHDSSVSVIEEVTWSP